MRRTIHALALATLVAGCSGDADPFAVRATFETVPGIVLRSEAGEVLGIWGSPTATGGVTSAPNPADGRIELRIDNPGAQRVRVDVIALLAPGESVDSAQSILGSTVVRRFDAHVRTLLDRELEAGLHAVIWDGLRDDERPTGDGFYRIRVTYADGTVDTDDVLLWSGDPSTLPAGIAAFFTD